MLKSGEMLTEGRPRVLFVS